MLNVRDFVLAEPDNLRVAAEVGITQFKVHRVGSNCSS